MAGVAVQSEDELATNEKMSLANSAVPAIEMVFAAVGRVMTCGKMVEVVTVRVCRSCILPTTNTALKSGPTCGAMQRRNVPGGKVN